MFRRHTVRKAVWCRNVLMTRRTKRPVALRYLFNGELRVYIYEPYKEFADIIEHRPDTKRVLRFDDVLGEVSFVDWDDFISGIRQEFAGINEVLPEPEYELEDIIAEFSGEMTDEVR